MKTSGDLHTVSEELVQNHLCGEHGSRQVGMALAGVITQEFTSYSQVEGRESLAWAFETSKLIPSDTPPTKPHHLILPKTVLQIRAQLNQVQERTF